MNYLFENDISFLIQQTKLSEKQLLSLVETERDFDLLLESVAILPVTKERLWNLSFFTYIKFIIYKYSQQYNFSLEEKNYVAKMIYKNFPRLQMKVNFGYLSTADTSEKLSQYYLVLMGFFYKRLKKKFFTVKIWNQVENGFKIGQIQEFHTHLKTWVNVLHKIENDDWFMTSKTNKEKICEPIKSSIVYS